MPAQLSLAFGRLDLREDCLESLLRIKGPEQQSERLHAHLRKCLPHLKLSTELGARHKCAHCKHARVRVQRVSFPTKSLARLTVERPEPTRREVLGNVSQDDALREPLADGRLADALHMTELRLRARQMRRERVTASWIVYPRLTGAPTRMGLFLVRRERTRMTRRICKAVTLADSDSRPMLPSPTHLFVAPNHGVDAASLGP